MRARAMAARVGGTIGAVGGVVLSNRKRVASGGLAFAGAKFVEDCLGGVLGGAGGMLLVRGRFLVTRFGGRLFAVLRIECGHVHYRGTARDFFAGVGGGDGNLTVVLKSKQGRGGGVIIGNVGDRRRRCRLARRLGGWRAR